MEKIKFNYNNSDYSAKFNLSYGPRAQVTIFVILGIVIVVGVLLLVLLNDRGIDVIGTEPASPRDYVRVCVDEAVEDTVANIFRYGGEVYPTKSVRYLDEEYNYLCHTADSHTRCYNLHPLLELQIEERIEEDTRDEVQGCFDSLRSDLESRGFEVNGGATAYSVDIVPGSVNVNLQKDISVQRGGTSESYSDFDTRLNSPLYELVKISKTIVTSESRFCAFERNGYMIFYPEYDIKMTMYDNSKLYTVVDRQSGSEFKFAVRTCAVPALL